MRSLRAGSERGMKNGYDPKLTDDRRAAHDSANLGNDNGILFCLYCGGKLKQTKT